MMGPDQHRFTDLMTEHGRAVLGYLARRTVPVDDAADLMAEVFVVAWRRLDVVPADGSEARAWLLGVARGLLNNHRRGSLRRNRLADKVRDQLMTSRTQPGSSTTSAIHDALARLSSEDREVLTLVAWDGLSPAQAAQIMGLSATTARKRLERARARLRTQLAVADEAPDGTAHAAPLSSCTRT